MDIKGQWYGRSAVGGAGVRLDLDRRIKGWSGSAYVSTPDGTGVSAAYAVTLHESGEGEFAGHADFRAAFDAQRNSYVVPEGVENPPTHVVVDADVQGEKSLFIRAEAGSFRGEVLLHRMGVNEQSSIPETQISWKDYKETVLAGGTERRIFRGQAQPWPLVSTFHRTSRADIYRYSIEDVGALALALQAHFDKPFDLKDPLVHAAVIALAQHHGMPTPLLDWTMSPYVAAYFAVREAAIEGKGVPTVFSFEANEWQSRFHGVNDISSPMPALAALRPPPISNPRQPVQQSVYLYSNMADLESLVLEKSKEQGVEFLQRYSITDPPRRVLKDLRLMGLHAASLFPGLDGTCRGVFESMLEPHE